MLNDALYAVYVMVAVRLSLIVHALCRNPLLHCVQQFTVNFFPHFAILKLPISKTRISPEKLHE
jgi:hypothetical protein